MKKSLIAVLIMAITLSTVACGTKTLEGNLGNPISSGDFEFTVEKTVNFARKDPSYPVACTLCQDINHKNTFLTTAGYENGESDLCDSMLMVKDGYTAIVVTYSVKNTGGKEATLSDDPSLVIAGEYEYEPVGKYFIMDASGDSWKEFDTLSLGSLSEVKIKEYYLIPDEAFEMFKEDGKECEIKIKNITFNITDVTEY